jgi:hypothetical protein
MKNVILMGFALISSQVFAAGAASWTCQSNHPGLTADYAYSMIGDSLTLSQSVANGAAQIVSYYSDDTAHLPQGQTRFLQVDPTKAVEDSDRQLAGTQPVLLTDLKLTGALARRFDMGFTFNGSIFLCTRD